jgi:serine/threonine protein kinase
MIGELIDHYRVLELVGRGAMGVVYKALDVNLDRTVAIKVMSAEARGDPDFVERFRQEARVQGALNHPNVALLFDYFVHDGAPVAVMEFIDGESLEQLIRRRGAIPAREAIPLFKQALRGVAAAHRAGIVHRDLKPANLMVTRDHVVKVMDFGIAKRQGVTGATKASTSIGSPFYMAPEQILGRAVDCRTDVYALGITLYELLSGYRPFNTRGKAEYLVLDAHVNDLPEPPTVYRLGIPQPVVHAVMRSLAKEPDARFQSAEDFMNALPDVAAPLDLTGVILTKADTDACGEAALPDAAARPVDPTGTTALEYSPTMSGDSVAAREPGGTMAFEYAPTKRLDPHGSMEFNYSAGTVWQQLHPPDSAPSTATTAALTTKVMPAATSVATRPSNESTPPAHGFPRTRSTRMQLRRLYRPAAAGVLVALLALSALVRHPEWLHVRPPSDAATSSGPAVMPAQTLTAAQAPSAPETAAPSPTVPNSAAELVTTPSASVTAATVVAPTAAPLAATTARSLPDLSGTWRGEYVDASGRELLRVVNLSISRVHDDGGIEGTLQYESASGDGECKLHARGSAYSAGEQRLQLSPEGCSPHYPRELGVPLDFDAVDPRANTLKDGRIEAPTGEVIRVKLTRVSGV